MPRPISGFEVLDYRQGPLVCKYNAGLGPESLVEGWTDEQYTLLTTTKGEDGKTIGANLQAVFYLARAAMLDRLKTQPKPQKMVAVVIPYVEIKLTKEGDPLFSLGVIGMCWEAKESNNCDAPYVTALFPSWMDLADLCGKLKVMFLKEKNGKGIGNKITIH